VTPDERDRNLETAFAKFTALMERANFKRLSRDEIQQALNAVGSEAGVDTFVDLNLFERLEVFVRGDVMGKRYKRLWWKPWSKEAYAVPMYKRFVLMVKLRKQLRSDADVDLSKVYLKVFKDIPKVDQDMLLPGARIRLSRLDRALIVYPLATGVGLLLYNIVSSALNRGGLDALLAGVGGALASWAVASAIFGYGYKSYYSYQVKKQNYSLKLTKSLYFKSLDNNAGVLNRLLDEAEEQECRETFLAYYCLWRFAPPQGWTAEQLDDYVEIYLERYANLKVDFEIGDALAKLERLKIVTRTGDTYRAQPLDKALEMLDWIWDNYFKYNTNSPDQPPGQ
jgi:hypothetical protein